MLKQRVITASFIAAVFLLVLLVAPSEVFAFSIVVVVALAAWEWANLAGLVKSAHRVAYVLAVLSCGGALHYAIFSSAMLALDGVLMVSGAWWAIALLWVQSYPASALLWGSTPARAAIGLVVLLPTLLSLYALNHMANGQWMVIAVVLLVAAADIGAYFAGRKFGKRKLAPRVSPGKTWAGAVGGLFAVALIAAVYGWLSENSVLLTLAVCLPAAAASILGDLLESMFKRHRGIKDSGQLLPGHGGVLDRIDGLLAAAPVFALAVVVSGWQI